MFVNHPNATADCGRISSAGGGSGSTTNYPRLGKLGMASELQANDGGGFRSSLEYATAGYRVTNYVALTLGAAGLWNLGATEVKGTVNRIDVGIRDFHERAVVRGWRDYDKGGCAKSWPNPHATASAWLSYWRAQCVEVLLPFHGL